MNRREIKFKVWCKENEEFIQLNKMGFSEDGSLWYAQGIDENEEETDPPYFENQNDWELMQYTGLKDRTGVEIYEGDIIGFDWGDYYFSAIVRKGGWYWYGEMLFGNDTLNFDEIGNEDGMMADCDVLGNTYENPELLEREN